MIVSFVLMIAMAYTAAIWHIYVLYAVFALIPILVVLPAVEAVMKTRKAENISLDDYKIAEDTVHDVYDETHVETRRTGKYSHSKETVINYYIRFDSGKVWQLPCDLYSWSEEFNMSPVYVYRNAHRGDRFITVTYKKSGEIAVAYNTEFFEYN